LLFKILLLRKKMREYKVAGIECLSLMLLSDIGLIDAALGSEVYADCTVSVQNEQ
jgi:hypothetical protein